MTKSTSIIRLNKNLCLFIKDKFFNPFKIDGKETSLNKYAKACNLSSSTISKINNPQGYNIPVSTIFLILEFEKVDLAEFFTEFASHTK